MDLEFLSEPVTQDDIKEASGEREQAPDGQYPMVITGLKVKLVGEDSKPMLKVILAHTGESSRKYQRSSFSIFSNSPAKLAALLGACGIDATGALWGKTGDADEYGRFEGFIVNAAKEPLTDKVLGKELIANLKTNDKGFQGATYVKAAA
jgi:hypothetical protein